MNLSSSMNMPCEDCPPGNELSVRVACRLCTWRDAQASNRHASSAQQSIKHSTASLIQSEPGRLSQRSQQIQPFAGAMSLVRKGWLSQGSPRQLPCTESIRPLLSDKVLAEFHLHPPPYLLLVLLRAESTCPQGRGKGEGSTQPQSKGGSAASFQITCSHSREREVKPSGTDSELGKE